MSYKKNIVLFIDAENAPANKFENVINFLSERFNILSIKAYANWKNSHTASWEKIINKYAINPIQLFDVSKGKNASDMAIAIDALELVMSTKLATVAVYSSDSDFTPLLKKMKERGIYTICFGEKKAKESICNACNEFVYVDDFLSNQESGVIRKVADEMVSAIEKKKKINISGVDGKSIEPFINIATVIVNYIKKNAQHIKYKENGIPIANIGNEIKAFGAEPPEKIGFKSLKELLESVSLFNIHTTESMTFLKTKQV